MPTERIELIVDGRKKAYRLDAVPPEVGRQLAMPSGFARSVLGMSLYENQAKVVDAFAPFGSRVTVRTANEFGKTKRLITTLILWHMIAFPASRDGGGVVATSGSWTQIEKQLMPSLHGYAHLFPYHRFRATDILGPTGVPEFVAFSTSDPGRAEGFHGTDATPLLAIVDEAKTVQDSIYTALDDRCNPQRLGLFSSPGFAEGEFYRSHTINSALYERFVCRGADPVTCQSLVPHISQDSIDRRIQKWGREHPLVKSMIFADFMESVEGAIISLKMLTECMDSPPQHTNIHERRVFCDFAAGGDENVIAVRHGNRVWIHRAWRETDTMKAAGEFVVEFRKLKDQLGITPEDIEGDDQGLGKSVIDRLAELGWPIGRFHGQAPALDPHGNYQDRNAECWWGLAEQIRRKALIIQHDDDLVAQLVDRKMVKGRGGSFAVEPKSEMKKRGVDSPDRADAVVGCALPSLRMHMGNAFARPTNVIQQMLEAYQDGRIVSPNRVESPFADFEMS